MMMIYLLILVGLTLQGVLIYFLIKSFVQNQSESNSLKLLHNLNQLQTDLRQTVSDRLSTGFLDTQDRLEKSLALNRGELQNGLRLSTQALESKFQSLETQVGLRLESIGRSVESKLNENLKEGFKHFEKIQQHLQAAEIKLASLNTVGQSIADLNHLLKLPHLRGGFGEASLERLLADFLPVGSYELQHALVPHSSERVDAAVRLSRHWLPIDSKFPREQVLPLFESQDPTELEGARKNLSDFIKTQAKSIAQKYIRPEHGTTDMALLFLPSETLYFEVIRNGALFEFISKLKVFPVSPNTLSISLQAIAMAQEYYEMSRGIEKTIEDIRKAKKHFDHFERKFDDVGKGLKKAQEAFDTAHTHLGHYGSSVFRLTGETPEALEQLPPQLPQ